MNFKPLLKIISVTCLTAAVFAILIAFAMVIGGGLGKAAKISSKEDGLKQQSAQVNMQTGNDQVITSRQQNEANQAVSNITYFTDPRTNICFAYLNIQGAYGYSRSITTVNCGFIPKKLLITVKK